MAPLPLASLSDANAGWGTITYNGYQFPGLREVKLSRKEEYDGAGRVVVGSRYVLWVHYFVCNTDATGQANTVALMRTLLQEPGQALRISGMPFGDIYVDTPASGSNRNDIQWGPKPVGLELIQIGSFATECFFEIGFFIKQGLSSNQNVFAAFNYLNDWSFDDAGICTRTLSGHVQVSLTRVGVGFSADAYRNQINVLLPEGFARQSQKFTLSEDRAKLSFAIVDRQLDAEPPPAGVLKTDLEYGIESIPPGFARWSAYLTGSIETPAGVPPVLAGKAFMRIFIDRQQKLSNATGGLKGLAIPARIKFSRVMGSRVSNFSVAWLVTACLNDLLRQGGIWEPVSGLNYKNWRDALGDAIGVRGTAGLAYNSGEDALIDLNRAGTLPLIGTGPGTTPKVDTDSSVFRPVTGDGWLYFENSIEAYRVHDAVTHRSIERYLPPDIQPEDNFDELEGVSMTNQITSANTRETTQYAGAPVDLVVMRGKAIRYSKQPRIPRLVTLAGRRVQEVKVRMDGPKVIGCIFDQKVYSARWAILYRLTNGYASSIPTQKNPAFCCADE